MSLSVRRAKLNQAQKTEIALKYLEGLSSRQVALALNLSKTSVGRLVKEIGLSRDRTDAVRMAQPGGNATTQRSFHAEARKIVERSIGRKLSTWEHVHHKDRDWSNNSIDNLELMTASEHERFHHTKPKVVFVCEICSKRREVTQGYRNKIRGNTCSRRCASELRYRK